MLLVLGRTIGHASLLVSLDLLSLPPTCNTSLQSRKGSSLNKLLDRSSRAQCFNFSKNHFLCIILNMTFAVFSNISTFSSFGCLSDVCFLIFFNHWFLAKITIAITLFIFNQFRVSAINQGINYNEENKSIQSATEVCVSLGQQS